MAGEDEHGFAAAAGQVVLGKPGVGLVQSQCVQGLEQLAAGVCTISGCGDGRAVAVMGAGGGQAVGHIGEIQVGMIEEVLMQTSGLPGQRRGAARGDRPEAQWGVGGGVTRS